MAAAGVGAAITLVELRTGLYADTWVATSVLLTALVGLPLTLAAVVFAEAREFMPDRRRVFELAAVVATLLYYLTLPADWRNVTEAVYLRTAVIVLGLHFVVAFAPFAGRRREAEFWGYNWRLFLRFWLGALYSAVLYVGLVAAVASASQLFDLKIKGERYIELWLLVVGLFNTCFVLHEVPRIRATPGPEPAYPRGLRMFAQFALAPLVVVYLAILYPYAGKILWLGAWPKGWVALPILCLAVAGILAALFLHPVRERPEERWAAWYWRWFFRALFPLTVLLYLALRVRVHTYGVTEARYFGFVLAGWLAWTSAYYWWRANRSVRWLPASLAVLCLLTTWGPWGAFQVSGRSQFARLERMLTARGLLVGGVLAPKAQVVDSQAFWNLQSQFRYLLARHRSASLERLLAPYERHKGKTAPAAGMNPITRSWQESKDILAWLEVSMGGNAAGRGFSVQMVEEPGAIAGYSRAAVVLNLSRYAPPEATETAWPQFELERTSGTLWAVTPKGRSRVAALDEVLASATKSAHPIANVVRLPWTKLSVPATIDGHEFKLVVLQASGVVVEGRHVRVNNLSLLVLER